MKKQLGMIMFLAFLLLTACGGDLEWKAEIDEVPYVEEGTESPFSIQISEADEPVTDAEVSVILTMAKMDHGEIVTSMTETDAGVYEGKVALPMAGEWEAELAVQKGDEEMTTFVTFDAESGKPEASINGVPVTGEDLAFYKFINKLQVAMYREVDKERYEGQKLEEAMDYWDMQEQAANDKNTLLTQIIRLRAAALLAEEKGHQATPEEVSDALEAVRQQFEQSEVAIEMIDVYGKEKFWNKQKEQYEKIVLVQKVQQDVLAMVKEESPEVGQQEWNFQAKKKYEELLVSQMGTLDIKIHP